MNILYIDIDSLRPDHLGCYGYHRKTSPNIDALAAEGLRFTNCYAPDVPCLPSRTAMTTGRFGIHTGVINHGGVASQPFLWGEQRGFSCNMTDPNWAKQFQDKGYHTVAFSPFAQRHGAWHWYAGFMEIHNTGGNGQETADAIAPQVTDWLERKGGDEKPFFMWLNVWDPHTPYRTPLDFGNPFENDPIPDWYTEETRQLHWTQPGPHSAQEVNEFVPLPKWMERHVTPSVVERQPVSISSMEQAKRMFDGYDCGVAYADYYVGQIIQSLKDQGLYENTAIIISADHGENLGELNVYGDHQTADQFTCNIPMIVRWPGVTDSRAGESDDRLLYSLDMAATSLELSGMEVPDVWDGQGFAQNLSEPNKAHREHLVTSQAAWCCQRAARWDDYICIETYHDSWHDYPDLMVFDLANDPHEQNNLAKSNPELAAKGKAMIAKWKQEMMEKSRYDVDPMDTVLSEGGSLHSKTDPVTYLKRLRETGRSEAADRLAAKHGVQDTTPTA
ncbi:sulfatase family protein [Cerasicoccus frondis]|uniref:sulfatase family protein n=1 Tax=Cerasicoccus frondis TaxID=490090 RepID=UPI002852D5FC|nr:sulfatase [Cerasicoccus frondis]